MFIRSDISLLEAPMEINTAKISVEDVEELSYAVDPWEFQMNQLTTGQFRGILDLVQVGDIFVSREYWSKKITARGGSPTGYLLLAGPCIGEGFSWCGSRTDKFNIAYAADCTEVDFVTSDEELHWTILIPRDVIDTYLGGDNVDCLLPDVHFLSGSSLLTRDLFVTIINVLAIAQKDDFSQLNAGTAQQLHKKLLSTVARFLLFCTQSQIDKDNATNRFLAYQRARSYAEGLQAPITVENLARKVGTCRRTLELGFKENIGISPQNFLRQIRLNNLHRDLIGASRKTLTVTRAAEKWGFTELGRTAGYYRELFGAAPSETLKRDNRFQGLRFSDVLSSS